MPRMSALMTIGVVLLFSAMASAQTEPKEKKSEKIKEIKAKIEKLEKRLAELTKDDAAGGGDATSDKVAKKNAAAVAQKTFTLKFTPADAGAATLTKLLAKSKDTQIVVNGPTNQIVVHGAAKTVKKAEKILALLDVEAK